MSGEGAGVFVRVLLALWYWGSGRPVRWLVTIAGKLLFFSFASATNSSAVSTKPTTERRARAGIAAFRLDAPSALRVTVKPHYRDWSSWTVVQVSDADGIDVHREYAESQAVRE